MKVDIQAQKLVQYSMIIINMIKDIKINIVELRAQMLGIIDQDHQIDQVINIQEMILKWLI